MTNSILYVAARHQLLSWRSGWLHGDALIRHTLYKRCSPYTSLQDLPRYILSRDVISRMEDPILIACLYPADNEWSYAQDAIRMSENSNRYILPQGLTVSEQGSRESTVSVEGDEDLLPNYTNYPGLQLTFNRGLKAGQGFVLGTDSNRCDIVLPKIEVDHLDRKPRRNKVGRCHCCLTFDEERRLILRDFSRHGTTVTYDGQGRENRQHFPWILSGDGASDFEKIIIQIDKIRFQIVVSRHDAYQDLYNDNVDRFLLRANTNDELPFGALGIQSTSSTARQSGAQTPNLQSQPPIYISREKLGSGNFSIVNRVWDVSTGSVYACKEIFNMEESDWRKEASIMRKVSQLSNVR